MLVRWFVLAWVRLYTVGLPAQIRRDRRSEIESDIWEQAHADLGSGRFAELSALSIGLRALLGMRADLAWSTDVALANPVSTIGMRLRGAYLTLAPGYVLFAAVASTLHAVGWMAELPLALTATTAVAVASVLFGAWLLPRLPRTGAVVGVPGLLWLLDIAQYLI